MEQDASHLQWDAVSMVRPIFAQSDREMMVVMSVNTRLEPLALEIVAVGGVDSCNVDIKNIFKHALLNNASYIICFHNHPTGDPTPSKEDRLFTKRLTSAGQILNLPVIDHIIMGEETFYSFKEYGDLEVFPENNPVA